MYRIEPCLAACRDRRLVSLLTVATQAANAGGAIIRGLYGQSFAVRRKGAIDLVTEADIASERAILGILNASVPDVLVFAEESRAAYAGMPEVPAWIIDPLDGTTNFAHGFPWVAVSIGYAEGGRVRAGVIFNPLFDELFCALEGAGAWLNGKRIAVSEVEQLSESLTATGFPYDVREEPEKVLDSLETVLTRCQGVRRAGAAALDMAYVACGRLDGFWEMKLKPWDTAAGQIILEEAGGRVSDFSGGEYSPFIPEILATNGAIHGELLALLREYGMRS